MQVVKGCDQFTIENFIKKYTANRMINEKKGITFRSLFNTPEMEQCLVEQFGEGYLQKLIKWKEIGDYYLGYRQARYIATYVSTYRRKQICVDMYYKMCKFANAELGSRVEQGIW